MSPEQAVSDAAGQLADKVVERINKWLADNPEEKCPRAAVIVSLQIVLGAIMNDSDMSVEDVDDFCASYRRTYVRLRQEDPHEHEARDEVRLDGSLKCRICDAVYHLNELVN